MAELPAFAEAWLRQREQGAAAVAQIEDDELRSLDDAEALRLADALLSAAPIEQMTRDRKTTSGFVEQRLFMRARGR
jgi:hypothetical protein